MAQTSALVVPKSSTTTTTSSSFPLYSKKANYDSSNTLSSRRSTIKNVFGIGSLTTLSSLLTIVAKPSPSQADSQGLDGSTLDEPSVPYSYFLDALDKGNVEFVEFFAPSGDKAYVTFKAIEGVCTNCRPVRIGEGYPVEQAMGIQSPAFVVKKVKEKNVPYKFTLPALANYK